MAAHGIKTHGWNDQDQERFNSGVDMCENLVRILPNYKHVPCGTNDAFVQGFVFNMMQCGQYQRYNLCCMVADIVSAWNDLPKSYDIPTPFSVSGVRNR